MDTVHQKTTNSSADIFQLLIHELYFGFLFCLFFTLTGRRRRRRRRRFYLYTVRQ